MRCGEVRAQHCVLVRCVSIDVFDASDHCFDGAIFVACCLLVDDLAAFAVFLI